MCDFTFDCMQRFFAFSNWILIFTVALQFPEGLLLFACTIADIIEEYVELHSYHILDLLADNFLWSNSWITMGNININICWLGFRVPITGMLFVRPENQTVAWGCEAAARGSGKTAICSRTQCSILHFSFHFYSGTILMNIFHLSTDRQMIL